MKNFENKRVHFIGIGGISMSALALEVQKLGAAVSGSDLTCSHITERLQAAGIEVFEGHTAENVADAQIIVKNSAIKEDNPELAAARADGAEIIDRAGLLGIIMSNFQNKIAVAGMHGKTTATGLVASALATLNPAVHIGGEIAARTNAEGQEGGKSFFVTEACEYCRNFLCLSPDTLVVLNIDEDHLDYYKDLSDIIRAFEQFAALVPKSGRLIINGDDENCRRLKHGHIVTFGMNEGNGYRAENITCERGRYSFSVRGEKIKLNIFGLHQVYNALAAFAVGDLYGVPHGEIARGIEAFTGVKRRFELFDKKLAGADVIIDYAHHPKEIDTLLKTAREAGYEKLWCVFQPHTYTRTEALLKEFAASLAAADEIILMPVYAAREKRGSVDSETLLKEINRPFAVHIESGAEVIEYLRARVNKNDAVLITGAGNIVDICKYI